MYQVDSISDQGEPSAISIKNTCNHTLNLLILNVNNIDKVMLVDTHELHYFIQTLFIEHQNFIAL